MQISPDDIHKRFIIIVYLFWYQYFQLELHTSFILTQDIFKLMEEGQRLLNLLSEQQTQQSKKAASEQMAGVLVNNLLMNGFHIIPPESTPRPVDDSWTLPVSEDDKESVDNVVMGNQIIVDMHRELKRLQIN